MTELQAKNIDLSGKLQQMQCERDRLANRLVAATEEVEELQCQIMSYVNHLEQSRKESTELRAQLDSARVETQSHSSKGNSLFSELEDRRQDVEKKMSSLRVHNQQLKEKYEIEKQQNHKYKMHIAMALQSAGHKHNDATVQRLQSQLTEANAEMRALSEQIHQLETTKGSTVEHLASSDLLLNAEDKNYAEYLRTIIKCEKEATAKARSELQTKTLQYLDMSNQNVELSRQTQALRSECDKLQAALLKMSLQKEELQLKYEPEKVKGGSLQKRVVEKIDLGDDRLQPKSRLPSAPNATGRLGDIFAQTTISGRKSNIFKAPSMTRGPREAVKPFVNPPTGSKHKGGKSSVASGPSSTVSKSRPSTTGLLSASQTKGAFSNAAASNPQDSTLFLKDDTTFYDVDKENLSESMMDSTFALLHGYKGSTSDNVGDVLLQGRKVSMSDNVRVVEAHGGETIKALSDKGDGHIKPEVAKKKQEPKKIHNVKHVKADEAPQVECKQQ